MQHSLFYYFRKFPQIVKKSGGFSTKDTCEKRLRMIT
jgi:hypothetical protein